MKSLITVEYWPVSKFVRYASNPRKNDHAVDRMVTSIQEFGLKIPLLVRSNGEVLDGTFDSKRTSWAFRRFQSSCALSSNFRRYRV